MDRRAGLRQGGADALVPATQVCAGPEGTHVVDGIELLEVPPQPGVQRVVHREHAGPQRVPADRGHLDGLQDRGERRLGPVGHVGVPLRSVGLLVALPGEDHDVLAVRVRPVRVVAHAQGAQ